MISVFFRYRLIALSVIAFSLSSAAYGQTNIFEGEIKFLQNSDLLFDEQTTYLVKDEKVYKFIPPAVADLTGGYSRESLEVTDTSIINVLYNPKTGDSIVSEFSAKDNHGILRPLPDTIIDGNFLSGNLIDVSVRGFIAGDSLRIKTKIYYTKEKFRFRKGESNVSNNVFCTPQFEIPYCFIKYTKEKYGAETKSVVLKFKRATKMSLDIAQIHERWYEID